MPDNNWLIFASDVAIYLDVEIASTWQNRDKEIWLKRNKKVVTVKCKIFAPKYQEALNYFS